MGPLQTGVGKAFLAQRAVIRVAQQHDQRTQLHIAQLIKFGYGSELDQHVKKCPGIGLMYVSSYALPALRLLGLVCIGYACSGSAVVDLQLLGNSVRGGFSGFGNLAKGCGPAWTLSGTDSTGGAY
jgi:hypothetical protein